MGIPTTQLDDLACRLLKFEQQLKAYEKLHAEEVAELWQTLNEWKREITDGLSNQPSVEQPAHERVSDQDKDKRGTSKEI